MQKLAGALRSLLKDVGIEKAVLQNRAILEWETIVGKAIGKNARPEQVRHGVLVLKASSPVWRNELALRKGEILMQVNRHLGRNVIRDIKLI